MPFDAGTSQRDKRSSKSRTSTFNKTERSNTPKNRSDRPKSFNSKFVKKTSSTKYLEKMLQVASKYTLSLTLPITTSVTLTILMQSMALAHSIKIAPSALLTMVLTSKDVASVLFLTVVRVLTRVKMARRS